MMRSSSDRVVAAMRSGAGLPVLSILDKFLEAKARGEGDQALEDEALTQVLDGIEHWLDDIEAKVLTRLQDADAGPLADALDDYTRTLFAPRRRGLEAVRAKAASSESDAPAWALLEAEFLRLHTLRREVHDLHKAATHLREVSRLVTDIPDNESGKAALDELARQEALAASHHTPTEWAKAARELERLCMRSVSLALPTETASASAERQAAVDATDVAFDAPASKGNGHKQPAAADQRTTREAGPRPQQVRPTSAAPERRQPAPRPAFVHGSRVANGHRQSAFERMRPNRAQPTRAGAAGGEVLAAWKARASELGDQGKVDGDFRHPEFWAPIAWGLVPPPRGDVRDLLEFARDVEIDLVEIEIPRVLAMATGTLPEDLRERIAERAREITLRDPKQPARQTLLEYIVGKLPIRYRDSAEGLALVESISFALATDEPWESSEHDYAEVVRNMVAAELDRSPALDVEELAVSLVGHRPEALEIVEVAIGELADEDPAIQIYPDGIVVRALAQREDPDKLYKLRAALESRLGAERAAQLMKALITAGEEDQ